MNALIPGINNWNTVGSRPLKQGLRKGSQYASVSNLYAGGRLEPPNVPTARHSKYMKLKELENEYYNQPGINGHHLGK